MQIYQTLSMRFMTQNSTAGTGVNLPSSPLKLAFIGGGNMASALASGLIGKRCGAQDVLIVDPHEPTRQRWADQGVGVAVAADERLCHQRIWVLAVKPQVLRDTVQACRPFLQPDTLVISVAAGIDSTTLSRWLGTDNTPWGRLIRCMPNTPALVGEGAAGLLALPGVDAEDKAVAERMFAAVGTYVWVADDAAIDAVTALSGSGPAYVFLFLEAMIKGGLRLGLDAEQSRKLALATVQGATQLAGLSPETPTQLRDRVTSKGGTTAAALGVLESEGFSGTVIKAMQAAAKRAAELSKEFGG